MMKVLITGCAGFIGSHLAEALLARGIEVAGVDSFDPLYPRNHKEANLQSIRSCGGSFHFVEGDIRDERDLAEAAGTRAPDAVVHLAAKPDMRQALQDPPACVDVNVGGTLQVLELCRELSIGNLVFASTSLVYGSDTKVPFRETYSADRPVSLYGATKRAGELLCHTYHHMYGLNVTCLRFFTVYGPRQRPGMAIRKFVGRVMHGEEIPVHGFGKPARDFAHVTDIVGGILAALDRMGGYRTYNLGFSQAYSLTELIRTIEVAVGREAAVKLLPDQPGDVRVTFAGIDLAKAELEWEPRVSLEAGIEGFVNWYKEAGRKLELEEDTANPS